jgi:phage host-nuclease inhibitor protein Gam
MDGQILDTKGLEEALEELAAVQNEINQLNQTNSGTLSELGKEKRAQLEEDSEKLRLKIFIFANSHKAAYLATVRSGPRNGKRSKTLRSVRMSAATFGWRYAPPRVVIQEGFDEKSVVRALNDLGLTHYINGTKLDRRQLLRDRTRLMSTGMPVPGVAYGDPREYFFIDFRTPRPENPNIRTTKRLPTPF